MDNGTTTSKHKSSSPFPGILLFLGPAAIIFILCSLLQSSRNTQTGYQQLVWEFTYQQKFAALNEAAEEVCQLKNAVHDNMDNKNLPQIEHALLLHSKNYLLLADDYREHIRKGLYAHLVKENDSRVLTPQDTRRMACE